MDVKISVKDVKKTDNGTYVRFWPPVIVEKDKAISDVIILGYPEDIKSGDLRLDVTDENDDAFETLPPIILWPVLSSQEYVDFHTKYLCGDS